MRIDAHQHFWTLSRGDYGWMSPDLAPIYRDFGPDDIEPLRQAAGIDRTIVVQAADTVAETEFILALADSTDWVAGVVGWVDMDGTNAIKTLEHLARNQHFKGIRPMIQDIADGDWILRPALDPVFDALSRMGLTFDALVLPRHLKNLRIRLDRHPDLRCVIDHAAKPDLATGNLDGWRRDISDVAVNTQALCKLSGLLTEAGEDPTKESIEPAVAHILDVFGAPRLMFGSDWPVLRLASDYLPWVEMVDQFCQGLSAVDRWAIWGDTAAAFYNVEV